MISWNCRMIDIDPAGWAAYSTVFPRLSTEAPELLLWHESGLARRMLLAGEEQPPALHRVGDARQAARRLYDRHQDQVRRVVVTDLNGYDRLCAACGLRPGAGEGKHTFRERLCRSLCGTFDQNLAIFPEPHPDRGPVPMAELRAFLTRELPIPCCLLLAVFEGARPCFSFVVRMAGGQAVLITSFEHWKPLAAEAVSFTAEELDRAAAQVSRELGPVACGLFLQRGDFDRLFDGARHAELPGALILSGGAFGFSLLPGIAERALLCTCGLFAYLPVTVP